MIDLEGPKTDSSSFPDVTPLLDVVFILLIFFVISAAFALRGMDVDLPQVTESRQLAGKVLHVVLDANEKLTFDGTSVTVERLGSMLQTVMRADKYPRQIVLKASSRASVGTFMRTVDAIRTHGGSHLIIATSPAHSLGQTNVAAARQQGATRHD
ncbi:MAG: ExbD/TolR family protein [Desulfovibrio sp.]|uniref:ExbD/TolR family protein n=1 Tax=Desulfovibrio sp. 7SRBS1 TaxID=3378064 RepID=UPI003B3F74C2